MDPKIIEALINDFYQYAIVGGIIILIGVLLKSFVTTLATNIWMRWFNRSRMLSEDDTKIYTDGYWWELKKLGFNRVKLVRGELDDDGKPTDNEIYLEMPTSLFWKGKTIYK